MAWTLNSNSFYIMAIQHTPTDWLVRQTIHEINDVDIDIHMKGDNLAMTPIARIPKYNDQKLREANAALIVDAVNNNAGKGIDPNAVPKILEAIKKILVYSHGKGMDKNKMQLKIQKLAEDAIKAAELK